jgi:secondary thiamine-phosphate synthase enzyme
MHNIEIISSQKIEFINITENIRATLRESSMTDGALVVYVPHTTAGITINERADPNVKADIIKDLQRLVPISEEYYEHFEGNSNAHTMASLVGSSITVLVEQGKLNLGRWQGIFFCEFDGPRKRIVSLSC